MLRLLTTPKGMAILVIVLLIAAGNIYLRGPMAPVQLPGETVFQAGGLAVRNTLLASLLTTAILVGIGYLGTRRMTLVPGRLQGLVEVALEILFRLVTDVAGQRNGRRFFPVVATIFFFVVISNWMGLFPGFGSIGVVERDDPGFALNEV